MAVTYIVCAQSPEWDILFRTGFSCLNSSRKISQTGYANLISQIFSFTGIQVIIIITKDHIDNISFHLKSVAEIEEQFAHSSSNI